MPDNGANTFLIQFVLVILYRIRKKARYQELLDREQQFLMQQHAEELAQERRKAVSAFLHVRALMLHSALQLPLKAGSDNTPRSNPPSDRYVSFDERDKTASGKVDPDQANFMKAKRKATFENINSKLSELLENKESFRFETPVVSCRFCYSSIKRSMSII